MRNDIRQFEAKLYALRKTKDGTIVQLLIHPHDDVSDFVNLHIGTDLELAWTIGDPKPVEVEPIEVKVSKAAQARAEKPKRKFSEMSLPEQCGVRCEDGRFGRFLSECYPHTFAQNGLDVVATVREMLGVKSRADLSTNHDAANEWRALNVKYERWLTDETHGGSLNR